MNNGDYGDDGDDITEIDAGHSDHDYPGDNSAMGQLRRKHWRDNRIPPTRAQRTQINRNSQQSNGIRCYIF